MQDYSGDIEVVVHDDASTDSTRDIVSEYQDKHPSVFKIIIQKENQYSKGKSPTSFSFPVARGSLIAICEGDDYWVDPKKLSLQIEFLEKNKHKNFVGGLCKTLNNELLLGDVFPARKSSAGIFYIPKKRIFSMQDYIHTSTFTFRRNLLECRNSAFGQAIKSGDLSILLTAGLLDDDIAVLNRVVSNYRIHDHGTWTNLTRAQKYRSYEQTWATISNGLVELDQPEMKKIALENKDYFSFLSRAISTGLLTTLIESDMKSLIIPVLRFGVKGVASRLRKVLDYIAARKL